MLSKGKEPPKETRSKMETMLLTRSETQAWQVPHFQRPIRVNDKVRELAEMLKRNGGVINGILTLGKVAGDKTVWLADGQHRREAFLISDLPECIADVRVCEFDNMAELAQEFVNLNSRLVNMKPDDILRGMESNIKVLQMIRNACDFVGYTSGRRGTSSILSMSAMLKCWRVSATEIPGAGASKSALHVAEEMDEIDAQELIKFLLLARSAWGSDPEYYRLYGSLNLTLTMWTWRRLVLDRERHKTKRYILITEDQFRKCLLSLSANSAYLDYLMGRLMNDRDRSPCWNRLKSIFSARLQEEDRNKKIMLPTPGWAANS